MLPEVSFYLPWLAHIDIEIQAGYNEILVTFQLAFNREFFSMIDRTSSFFGSPQQVVAGFRRAMTRAL